VTNIYLWSLGELRDLVGSRHTGRAEMHFGPELLSSTFELNCQMGTSAGILALVQISVSSAEIWSFVIIWTSGRI